MLVHHVFGADETFRDAADGGAHIVGHARHFGMEVRRDLIRFLPQDRAVGTQHAVLFDFIEFMACEPVSEGLHTLAVPNVPQALFFDVADDVAIVVVVNARHYIAGPANAHYIPWGVADGPGFPATFQNVLGIWYSLPAQRHIVEQFVRLYMAYGQGLEQFLDNFDVFAVALFFDQENVAGK